MSESAVKTAVEKHTTSKISDIDDLESGVGSLGFRGEALAAIGAVSRLSVRTKPRGANRGTELRMVGGEVETVEPAGCPEGTTVEVSDLFDNVPARRKFLKQDATEFSHTNRVATGYALSNPEVALVLEHDDREVFSTTGQGSLEATVLSVYGREVAEAMIPVETDGRDSEDESEGALDGIRGVVSHPETTRASPAHCSVFVNGRYVTASAVRNAIVDAYGTQLAPDRYPFAVLFLSLPANAVDVNVHPRKLEVRFADESEVKDQVMTAVENALMDEGLVRSGAPRGRSAPEQTAIEPEHVESDDSRSDTVSSTAASTTTATETADTESKTSNESTAHDPSAGETATADAESSTETETPTESVETTTDDDDYRRAATPERSVGGENETKQSVETERKFTEAVEQTTLDGENVVDDPAFDRLPRLRVLGQLHETYVVCESPDGLVLLDQHAADERINYERLRERFTAETTMQELTDSVEIELTAAEGELFSEFEEALLALGFRATRTDDRRVEVEAVPAVLDGAADPELLCDALSAFVGDGRPGDTVEQTADALLADLACYPSITGNTSLTEGTIIELLHALDACENPYACPHGRPVILELSGTELEDRFERDYPGHAGRRPADSR